MDHTTKTITEDTLLKQFSKLPEEAQREAFDFLEFLVEKKSAKKRAHPKAGFLKGVFKMSKDFDEPLEDFKEYMQ